MITRSGVRAVGRSGGNAGREGRWSWGGLRNADAMPWAPQTGRSVIVAAVRRSKAGKVGDDHRAGGRRSPGKRSSITGPGGRRSPGRQFGRPPGDRRRNETAGGGETGR